MQLFDKYFDFYSLLLKILSKFPYRETLISLIILVRHLLFVEYVRTSIFPFRSRVPPGRCPLFSLRLGVRSLSTIKTMCYKLDICIYSAQRARKPVFGPGNMSDISKHVQPE